MKTKPVIILSLLLNVQAMAKEISTEIRINASPEKIWSVLTDFEKYPEWNPFIKSIEGSPKVNNRIKAQIQAPGSREMTFKPKVLVHDENQKFAWLGHLFFPGLFDGRHQFEIKDNGDGTCTFIQSESFKGVLVPLFKSMLDNETLEGFRAMNESLKVRSESLE
jgi:hypothetical protein